MSKTDGEDYGAPMVAVEQWDYIVLFVADPG